MMMRFGGFNPYKIGPPGGENKQTPGTPRPTIYKWWFQLDDEPNLYIGNAWKGPNIHL